MLRIAEGTRVRDLSEELKELTGEDVSKCIQCGKCSAGCALSPFMDLLPHQVMKLVQLGHQQRIFTSSTPWLCVSCEACTSRCPESIDIAKVMDSLRKLCIEKGYPPKEKDLYAFNTTFLDSIRKHGRVYELGFTVQFNLATGKALRHLGETLSLALNLWRKGRIGLVPHEVYDKGTVQKTFETAERFVK